MVTPTRQIVLILAATSSLFLTGCYQFATLKPEELIDNTKWDITVTNQDGQQVLLEAGDYNLVKGADSLWAIQGHGLMLDETKVTRGKPFEGTIPLGNSLAAIEGRRPSTLYYAMPVAAVVGVGLYLWYRSWNLGGE